MVLSACVALPRTSFTAAEQAQATPPGFVNVRWTEDDPALAASLVDTLRPDSDGVLHALALSGGGANGAYGVGLITEWTHIGGRPVFQLVTGVSTGALTAPFAFLGPAWDAPLASAFATDDVQHLLEWRGPLSLFTPGFYSKRPLERLVRRYVTDAFLGAIAAEHAKGRRLLVATTDLDTEQLVVWDMGAIATKGGPAARKLFADVLVASASVPEVFPPSLITVEAEGHTFQELHVDGQTESAFFGIPQSLLLAPKLEKSPFHVKFYLIINGSLASTFALTPRSTLRIFSRAIDVSDQASIRSLLIANAEFCRESGCELYVASLPPSVKDDPLDFSAAHIKALAEAGKAEMDAGRAWRTRPPPRAKPAGF